MSITENDCPRSSQRNHSPLKNEPFGYVAWHNWAEEKIKTHHQERCPDCGLLAIWKPGGTRDDAK